MKLYALVTIGEELRYNRYGTKYKFPNSRCIGIYTNVDLATEAVLNNYGDMYEEGWYPWVVIESKISDVVYAGSEDEQLWFEWDKDKGGYRPILRPERFDQISGWGIG